MCRCQQLVAQSSMCKLAILRIYISCLIYNELAGSAKEESDMWNLRVRLSWLIWVASENNFLLESIQNGTAASFHSIQKTQLQKLTLYNIIKVVWAPNLWRLVDTRNESNWWDHMVRRSVWTSFLVFHPEKLVAAFLTANPSHTL